ncbi:MAG: nucleotidyl transferase AbiEii/AbiGii toxin family protein [Bacteroidales bacterium]|nr:nucleotidyl transferase AbiEii/AbiGii toxin family protein [Bacteroidales bacterium]
MLHYETVTPYLKQVLVSLMTDPVFNDFRLVGGTSLSLRLGHRMSIDIDLFSDAEYGTLDFHAIQAHLRNMFPYCAGDCGENAAMGTSYIVGTNRSEAIKLDLFYTDRFIADMEREDGIRMASIEDIIAMKLDVIARGGRKKDFWDIHELLQHYSVNQMIELYECRYPYGHSAEEVRQGFINFQHADYEPDPNCLKGKDWGSIKRYISYICNV